MSCCCSYAGSSSSSGSITTLQAAKAKAPVDLKQVAAQAQVRIKALERENKQFKAAADEAEALRTELATKQSDLMKITHEREEVKGKLNEAQKQMRQLLAQKETFDKSVPECERLVWNSSSVNG